MSINNSNNIYKQKLRKTDLFAKWLTDRVGTIGFFFLIFLWTISWMGWNIFAPIKFRFDPYPAFVLWLFISNMLQIFLMPLIMVGQNLQGIHSEVRAENDFKINLKAEKEIQDLKNEVGEIKSILHSILEEIK